MSIRFLADMGVSIRCIEWLRTQGYDAVHLSEQKLHKLTDSDVLKKAKNENRILLTMDLDFVQIIRASDDEELPLIIIFRLSDQRPLNIQASIKTLLPIADQYAKHGNAIISVGDNKARIRRLPIV